MTWYSTGTVSVSNSYDLVTGTNTDFVAAGVAAGHIFLGEDGQVYEILAVVSSTVLALNGVYNGPTNPIATYKIIPTQAMIPSLLTQIQNLVTAVTDTTSNVSLGRFAKGSIAAPGITFENDLDTGVTSPTTNEIALVTGGVANIGAGPTYTYLAYNGTVVIVVDNTGATVDGQLTVNDDINLTGSINGVDIVALEARVAALEAA